MDVKDENEVLPVYDGLITVKILQLSWRDRVRRRIVLKKKEISVNTENIRIITSQLSTANLNGRSFVGDSSKYSGNITVDVTPPLPPKPARRVSGSAAPANTPVSGINNVKQAKSSENMSSPQLRAAVNLLDPTYPESVSRNPLQSVNVDMLDLENDDFGMSTSGKQTPVYSTSNRASNKIASQSQEAMDIDTEFYSSANTSNKGTGSGEPLNRAELAAKREEGIQNQVKEALEFKKENDMKKEKEMADFDSAREKYDKSLLVCR